MKHKNIFRIIKRYVAQFIETEYWYRFRRHGYFIFDEDEGKFVNLPWYSYETLNSTWNGDGDILSSMLLKIEHQYHNLKHHGTTVNCYIESYNVTEIGTVGDKILCFDCAMKEYDLAKEKDLSIYVKRDGNKNLFFIEFDNKDKKYLAHEYIDGKPASWYIATKKEDEDNYSYEEFDINDIGNHLDIIDKILMNVYTINIPVEKIANLSLLLKEKIRGRRLILKQLLHLRSMIKRLSKIKDTDDRYCGFLDIEDEEERIKELMKARELYKKDRRELYIKIAEFMAEYGDDWWD